MMTAFDDMPTVVSAMRDGAVEFLVKPLDLRELRRDVDRVVRGPAISRAPTARRLACAAPSPSTQAPRARPADDLASSS